MNPKINKHSYETLKLLREKMSFSQAKLAEILDVNQSTISKWELGKRPIPKWVFMFLNMKRN